MRTVAMKRKLSIGRNTYIELVKTIGRHALPTRSAVKKHEDSIKIKLTPFMGGYKADLKDAIIKTIQRILQLKNYNYTDSSKFTVKISAGFDGSGSHIQRAGKDSGVSTKVFLRHSYLFLKKNVNALILSSTG